MNDNTPPRFPWFRAKLDLDQSGSKLRCVWFKRQNHWTCFWRGSSTGRSLPFSSIHAGRDGLLAARYATQRRVKRPPMAATTSSAWFSGVLAERAPSRRIPRKGKDRNNTHNRNNANPFAS